MDDMELWEFVDENARLAGLRDHEGVAFSPQVYSLERTSVTALFPDVLDFFDGDVPSQADVKAYQLRSPIESWGGQGPCSPAYPGDPDYWREGSRIPLRRIHEYHDAVVVETGIAFISRCNMPGILPGSCVEYEPEMGRVGQGGCVDRGPERDFLVKCAVMGNALYAPEDVYLLPHLLRAVMPVPHELLRTEVTVVIMWRAGDAAVRTVQAALADAATAERREAQHDNVSEDPPHDMGAALVVALRAYNRCTDALERTLQQQASQQKELSKLRQTRELASQTALNASIVLFFRWGHARGIPGVAYGAQGARGRPGPHDLVRSFYLAVVAVSYFPAPQALHMLYHTAGHMEDAQVLKEPVEILRLQKLRGRLLTSLLRYSRWGEYLFDWDIVEGGRVFFCLAQLLRSMGTPAPLRSRNVMDHLAAGTLMGITLQPRGQVETRLLQLSMYCGHGAAGLEILGKGVLDCVTHGAPRCWCAVSREIKREHGQGGLQRRCSRKVSIRTPVSCLKALRWCSARAFACIAGSGWSYIRWVEAIGCYADRMSAEADVGLAVQELRLAVTLGELEYGAAFLGHSSKRKRMGDVVRRIDPPLMQPVSDENLPFAPGVADTTNPPLTPQLGYQVYIT